MSAKEFDLKIYLKELEAIETLFKQEDENSCKFSTLVSNLQNYMNQVKCIENCEILREDRSSSQLNLNEIKFKVLFKLNTLINECYNELDSLL